MAAKQHIKHFFKNSFWSVLSTIVRAVSAIFVNKIFAIYYGPSGITLLAHFQNLIGLITTLPNSGVNVGLIRFLAQENTDSERYRAFFWTGLWLNLLSTFLVIGTILIFPFFFLDRFELPSLIGERHWFLFIVIVLIILLQLYLLWFSVILARQLLKVYVLLTFLTSILTIISSWIAVEHLSITLVLVMPIISQSIVGLIGGILLYYKRLIPKWQKKISKEACINIGKYILMAVSTLVGDKFYHFVVREMAMAHFSLYDLGIWQAVLRISDNYSMVYTSVLGMVYYPKVATLLSEELELKRYVRTILFSVIPLLCIAFLLLGWFKEYIILLLFNKEFLPAKDLLNYQMVSDFLKMVAFVFSYVVAVRAQVKLYVLIQLVFPVITIGLVAGLMPIFGIKGIIIAGIIGCGLYLLFHIYLFRSYFTSK